METTTIIVHHLQAAMVVVTARLRLVVTVIVRRPVQMDLTTADHALAVVLVLVAEAHVLMADPMADSVLAAEVLVLVADPMADSVLAAEVLVLMADPMADSVLAAEAGREVQGTRANVLNPAEMAATRGLNAKNNILIQAHICAA